MNCFQVFDAKGKLKDLDKTVADFDTALQMLKTLNKESINKHVKTVEAYQKYLFYFVKVAQNIVAQLEQNINPEVLQKLCFAWQTQKNAIKVKQNPQRKNALIRKVKHPLLEINSLIGQQYQQLKDQTFR